MTPRITVCAFFFLASATAFAAAPKIQVFDDVEKGFTVGLMGGVAWDFDPPVAEPGLGFLTGLELGYDLTWVLRLKAGYLSQAFSATAKDGSTTLPMDWKGRLVWGGASLALLATERVYAYIQAGAGYLDVSPKRVGTIEVAGDSDVAILAGGGLEYYTNLRHFSFALETMVSYLPGRGDISVALYPMVRYTFGGADAKTVKPTKDRDHDGVPDRDDKCPDTWGPQSNEGCPEADTDGDGVIDREDQCPQEPGPAANMGCPPDPDTDGDGVKDKLDRCPEKAGKPEMEGCPDRDDDGIPDHIDKCPDKPGKAEADGCPSKAHIKVRVSQKAIELREKIHFEINKAIIKKKSYPILNQVVAVLQQHPEIKKLQIEGHTDSQGPNAYNKSLSQRRAESVVRHLIDKGVAASRLVPKGVGEERPIATNKTVKGRSMNRRVEMIIIERE